MKKHRIAVTDRQSCLPVDGVALKTVLEGLLAEAAAGAELSVVVVDDEEMTGLNERFLGRRDTTDVIAFPYEDDADYIEGEVVINAQEAVRQAAERTHSAQDELLLYAVHGTLHLMGYDDSQAPARRAMHKRALELLAGAGRVLES
ncbi:MAG: rRNA maturation RNase YbeY [Candidatus Brocadiia bacterium]|nr:rRNA maturation RNase YbeY [Candidatus Brocadiia bacterium]